MNYGLTRRHPLPYVAAVAVILIYLGACGPAGPRIESTSDLVTAMKAEYEGKWYRTLTFAQETVRFTGEVPDTSIWYEAIA
ncbi:MAG: hypothetical protein R3282_08470, partial [Rhodothermales bacterium]|nr:hypothetical protein [Rhodothermales bacterium]